jgi:hypothetical protein
MDFVIAAPEYVAAAASDLGKIASAISDANSAALAPTSGIPAAGSDSVSAEIAALFSAHAQAYQALSAQANYFHQQFVQLMSSGASTYADAEAANVSPLQSVLQTTQQAIPGALNAPSQALVGNPSVSNSAAAVRPASFFNGSGTGYTLTSSPVTPGAAAPAALVSSRATGGVAGLTYGQGASAAASTGQAGNAVSAAAAAGDAELAGFGSAAAGDPAGVGASAAAQSALPFAGGNSGGAPAAGGRGSFYQSGGARGSLSAADGGEGQPA